MYRLGRMLYSPLAKMPHLEKEERNVFQEKNKKAKEKIPGVHIRLEQDSSFYSKAPEYFLYIHEPLFFSEVLCDDADSVSEVS